MSSRSSHTSFDRQTDSDVTPDDQSASHGDAPHMSDSPLPDPHEVGIKAPSFETDLRAYLAKGASYGFEGDVDQIELTGATLFEAGRYRYKLHHHGQRHQHDGPSMPLRLISRYHMARAELQLGRQYAPDLYVCLVPVYYVGGQFLLGLPNREEMRPFSDDPSTPAPNFNHALQAGTIVDWLIQMRRYDMSLHWDKWVDIQQPNFTDCSKLAQLVPAHALPATDSRSSAQQKRKTKSGHENSDYWADWLEERLARFAPTVRRLDRLIRRPVLRACLTRAQEQLIRQRHLTGARAARGDFVPLHGALHLGNIVRFSECLQLVHPDIQDCANAVVPVGDPLCDLAALVGDLWARGLKRQANWVFCEYCNGLAEAQRLDGLALLDLYLFLRSFEHAQALARDLSPDQLEAALKPQDKNTNKDAGISPSSDHDNADTDAFLADLQAAAQFVDAGDGVSIFVSRAKHCPRQKALQRHLAVARDCLVQDEAVMIVLSGGDQAKRSLVTRHLAPQIGRLPGALCLRASDVANDALLKEQFIKIKLVLDAGYSVVLDGGEDSQQSLTITDQLAAKLDLSPSQIFAFDLVDSRQQHLVQMMAQHGGAEPSNGCGVWFSRFSLDASCAGDILARLAFEHIRPEAKRSFNFTLH